MLWILAATVSTPKCRCDTPAAGTAGRNGYTCDNGLHGYCMSTQSCVSREPFLYGAFKGVCFAVPREPVQRTDCTTNERDFASRLSPQPPCTAVLGWPVHALQSRCAPHVTDLAKALGSDWHSRVVWASTVHGFHMLVYRQNDFVSQALLTGGKWEYDHLAYMESLRRPSTKRYADVGANLGYHTLVAAKRGYTVDAVEAMASNAAMINVSLCAQPRAVQQRVRLHRVGVSSTRKRCQFSSNSINTGDGTAHCDGSRDPALVPRGEFDMVQLHEVLKYDYFGMKIDIEGHEHEALSPQGSDTFFRRSRIEFILAESWPLPDIRRSLWKRLSKLGYATLRCSSHNEAQPFDEPFRASDPPPQLVARPDMFDVLAMLEK